MQTCPELVISILPKTKFKELENNFGFYYNILQTKYLVNRLWILLNTNNEIILKHKSIFDIEKQKLNYIDENYKFVIINKTLKIKLLDNNLFNNNTEFEEWNKVSNKINKKIVKFNDIIMNEKNIENNDINKNILKKTYILFIFLLTLSLLFYNIL
jgi:hypothetical protein